MEKINYIYVFIFAVLLIFISDDLFSNNYYISITGSDNNNGLSDLTPWQSITKVNQMMNSFLPGDQILFRKGDRFEGGIVVSKSGISGNEIVFGSYGNGELPVISGSKIITGWSIYNGNIYSANMNDTVSHFYYNNKLMTIARYPNSGWLRIDNPNGNIGFYDNALNQINGYWNSANCRLRTTNWCYETRSVSNFNSGNVTFASNMQYNTNSQYGYYLDNKLSLLDTAGEYFYDKSSRIIYFISPGGVNPSFLTAEVSVLKWGFYLVPGSHNIKIQNLTISKFKEKAIEVPNGNFNTVQNCNILQNGVTGIGMYGIGNIINNNFIEDNLDRGISVTIFNGAITNNNINRTGLIAGYGANSWGYIGLTAESSTGTLISNNIIDSSGYTGLRISGDNIVENNVIDYSLLTTNDGGGIVFDIADGLIIRNNIIMNSIGNTETSPPASYNLACGIGIGSANVKNVLVQYNTIAYNRFVGIHVDHTANSENYQILNNTLYDNFGTQMIYSDYSAFSYRPYYNNITKGNIFYSLNWKQICIEQQMYHSLVFSDFGIFDSNYYCNPYNEYVLKRTIMPPSYSSKEYRLDHWKTAIGKDLNSRYSQFSFDQFKVIDTIGINFINNPRFNNNLSGWYTWPSGSSIVQTINPLLDTGCMRIRWNGIGYSENFAISNTFQLIKSNYYVLSLSIVSSQIGEFTAWARPSIPGYYYLGFGRKFGYENYRKDYSVIFSADTTDPGTTISVGMSLPDSLFYVDNVNLYKVNVQRIDSTEKSKLFVNKTNSSQSISLNGIIYKDLDGAIVSGNISLLPHSSRILINDNNELIKTMNLNAFIEGLYDAETNIMISDTGKIYLRNNVNPYSIVDSSRSVISYSGVGMFNFSNAENGRSYFIVLKHRNSLETWSNSVNSFEAGLMNYNFSTAENKAYGNVQKQVDVSPVIFSIFSGDVTQDGSIDLEDNVLIYNDAGNFSSGYIKTDINGDNAIDLDDLLVSYNNSINFIRSITPP